MTSSNTPMLSIAQIKTIDYSVAGDWAEYVFANEKQLAVLLYTYEATEGKRCIGINDFGENVDLLFNTLKILSDAEIAS